MKKFKFIPYSFTLSWDEFISNIMDAKYTEKEAKGIAISDISKNKINGIYYEKVVFSETIYNPVQGEYDVIREAFFKTEFIFLNSILCLVNPSRRISSFFSYLATRTDFCFYIGENKLNMKKLKELIQTSIDGFKVIKSTYKFFSVNDNLKCSMSLVSKDNVLDYTKDMSLKLPDTPNKFAFNGFWKNREIKGDISETGLVSISCCDYDAFIDLFASNSDFLFSQ